MNRIRMFHTFMVIIFIEKHGFISAQNSTSLPSQNTTVTEEVTTGPNSPTDVSLVESAANFLRIKWQPPPGSTEQGHQLHYIVEMNGTQQKNVSVTEFSVDKLTSCSKYCFKIAAYSKFGRSEFTEPTCFVTKSPKLGTVEMNTIENGYSTARNISWTFVKHGKCAVMFNIQYSVKGSSKIKKNITTDHQIMLTGLSLDNTYTVAVSPSVSVEVKDGKPNGDFSKPVEFNTSKELAVPTDVRLDKRGPNELSISWKLPSEYIDHGPVSYFLVLMNDSIIKNVSNKYAHFTDLEPCSSYCFTISAFNKFGHSKYTKPNCYTTSQSKLGDLKLDTIKSAYTTEKNITWQYNTIDKCAVNFTVKYKIKDDNYNLINITTDKRYSVLKELIRSKTYVVTINAQSVMRTEDGAFAEVSSAEMEFNTDIEPGIPSNINLNLFGPNYLTISWNSPLENQKHGPVSYYIVQKNDSNVYNGSDKETTFDKLQSCTTYCFKIAAFSKFGKSDFSTSACYITNAPNLNIVKVNNIENVTSTQRDISWRYLTSGKCEVRYRVEYRIKDGSTYWYNVITRYQNITLKGLITSQTYEVRIQVQSEDGTTTGDYSAPIDFNTNKGPDVPSIPNLIASGKDYLKYSWNVNQSAVSNYIIKINGTKTDNVTRNTYTLENATSCTVYCVEIASSNRFGTSDFSNPACFATKAPRLAHVKVNRIANVYGKEANISWRYSNTDRCNVQFNVQHRMKESSSTWSETNTSNMNVILRELILSTTYEVKVRVMSLVETENGDFVGEFSKEVNFNTDIEPESPSSVSLLTSSSDSITISWKSFSVNLSHGPIDYYHVEWNNSLSSNSTTTHITVRNLESCAKYCFNIKAVSNFGHSKFTSSQCFKTTAPEVGPVKLNSVESGYNTTRNITWFYQTVGKCVLQFLIQYRSKVHNSDWLNVTTSAQYTLLTNLALNREYEVTIRADYSQETQNDYIYGSVLDTKSFSTSKNVGSLAIFVIILFIVMLLCGIVVVIAKRKQISLALLRRRIRSRIVVKQTFEADPAFSDTTTMRTLIQMKMPTNTNDKTLENGNTEKLTLKDILNRITQTQQPVDQFDSYFKKMSLDQNAPLITEYKRLTVDSDTLERSLSLTKFIGKSPYNLKKNRFQNILPFDQNRILISGKTQADGYINASYIPYSGDPERIEYIASQGPIETTINSFMLMIWEQKINCVVMLTQTYEDGKFKCMQYWPDQIGLKLCFGNHKEIILQLESEKKEISHSERRFSMKHSGSNETRIVFHLQMHTWCDYSAPDLGHFYLALTRFHELMETTICAPYLIHCSAGVGRTGTFICLDRIVRQLNNGAQYVDIYKTVIELRASRNFLVQRQAQYVFIHEFVDFFIRKFTLKKDSPTSDII